MNSSIFQIAFDIARELLISAGIGVPFFVCCYMIITPTHRICASWQNYRVSRNPHKALKDRHFKGLPRKVRLLRVASFFGFFLFLWLGLKQFHVDMFGFLNHIGK